MPLYRHKDSAISILDIEEVFFTAVRAVDIFLILHEPIIRLVSDPVCLKNRNAPRIDPVAFMQRKMMSLS